MPIADLSISLFVLASIRLFAFLVFVEKAFRDHTARYIFISAGWFFYGTGACAGLISYHLTGDMSHPLFEFFITIGSLFLVSGVLLYYFNPRLKTLIILFSSVTIFLTVFFLIFSSVSQHSVVLAQLAMILVTTFIVLFRRKWILQTGGKASYLWVVFYLLLTLVHALGFITIYSHTSFSIKFLGTFITNLFLFKALLHFDSEQTLRRIQENEKKVANTLKEKDILLKEVHHRVKNNMAIMNSLISLQSSFINDSKVNEQLIKARSRIRAMALVHEKLYEANNFAQLSFKRYILDLTSQIKKTLGNEIEIKLDIVDFNIDPNTLIPCGLIINELISNSYKHGFGKKKDKIIDIKSEIDNEGMINIMIKDNGKGLPENFDMSQSTGLGFILISNLIEQLNAKIEIKNDQGSFVRFSIPIRNRL